jgi:hypothetical protein
LAAAAVRSTISAIQAFSFTSRPFAFGAFSLAQTGLKGLGAG